MGFIAPAEPPVDVAEWRQQPHLERIKPLAQDWAINGFGTPYAVYLLYVIKLVIFSLGAIIAIGATTTGLGGLGDFGDWWTAPIVWQKLVVWTMLWEVLGLGAGSMPLTFRFLPPIGGVLYWLRPGMTRLPPWPDKLAFTRGTKRTLLDVALYAGVLASAVYLLGSDGDHGIRLQPGAVAVLLGFLALLGLRDKVAFLASRPEVYGFLLIVFLFPLHNMIIASQIVLVCIWWGAASSKLNRHFPFVVSVMISNTPWNPSRKAKAELYRDHPEDIRPSSRAALAAHLGTVMEFSLPFLLLVTHGGTIGKLAVIGMIIFHIHITSTFPLAVPLEWNLFMIFGLVFLFGHYGDVPWSTLDSPLLILLLLTIGVAIPVLGNLRPDRFSFLPAMRYYAGNWATTQWLFRKDTDAEGRLDRNVPKVAPIVIEQLTTVYDRDTAELFLGKGLAFRAMHSHGRALNGLLPHAVDEVEDYYVREGELISGVINGWNFGDGHLHNEQLLAVVQGYCNFADGDLRIITLESQPALKTTQHYRIFDAASGLIEEGYVDVKDMVERGPWLELDWDYPVDVTYTRAGTPTTA